MRIYLTHCSAKKDNTFQNSGTRTTPDKLYKATPTQRFMSTCKQRNVNWAIFSDLYGVWFPNIEHEWYEKDPDTVTEQEFDVLVEDFDKQLQNYDEIWFYHNPGRFHPLYGKLLAIIKLKDKVTLFTHIKEIE
jgi:hypothetical protein